MKAADLPLTYNAVNILEHNLIARPAKVALLTTERELTFQQVADEVNQLGNALKRLDVRQDEYVAILAPDCAEWAIAYFAALKIGAIAVGMNTLLTPAEHAYILNDCRDSRMTLKCAKIPVQDIFWYRESAGYHISW